MQKDDGFPIGCNSEEQWMSDCSIDYKPISCRRYVDNKHCYFRLNCDSGKFHTSFYRKPTFSGVLTNLKVLYPYRTNIILFPPCYVLVLRFGLPIKPDLSP